MTLALLIDIVGAAGAALTTLCWLPQAVKVIREKETRALSLPATLAFTVGIVLWLDLRACHRRLAADRIERADAAAVVGDPGHEVQARLGGA